MEVVGEAKELNTLRAAYLLSPTIESCVRSIRVKWQVPTAAVLVTTCGCVRLEAKRAISRRQPHCGYHSLVCRAP